MEQQTLKSLTTKIGSGATPRGGGNSYKPSGISLIRSMNVYDLFFSVKDLAYIDDSQAEQLANVEVHPQDVLLNITGASVARCCMVPEGILPARVNQHVAIVRLDRSKADPKYVAYCLNSPRYKNALLAVAQGGATREALTKSTIENFEIETPPLPTQHKIASILSAYDDLIENNTRRIKILEEMAQTIYREWFVHFRFRGCEDVPIVDSEWGQIPQGWEFRKLGELCSAIFSGGTPSTRNDDFWEGDLPWLSSGETRNRLIHKTEKHITPLGVENSSTRLALAGDVVVASAGQGNTRGQTSKCMIDTYINQSVIALRADNKSLVSDYLFAVLSTKYAALRAISDSSSSRGSLTQALLRDFSVLCPPVEVQGNFESLSDALISESVNLEDKNQNLRKTRDLLLPRLISGRLDVEDLDIAVK